MKPLCRMIAAFVAALCLATAPVAADASAVPSRPGWESVDTPAGLVVPDHGEIEVAVRSGYIYVIVDKTTKVCVFTVLGQPLTEANLQAGCHRFRISSRGIYILRAGSSTFRITI